jgi:hypothetical protein
MFMMFVEVRLLAPVRYSEFHEMVHRVHGVSRDGVADWQ